MENKMETTIVYRGYIGIMENILETTIFIVGCIYIYIICKYGRHFHKGNPEPMLNACHGRMWKAKFTQTRILQSLALVNDAAAIP